MVTITICGSTGFVTDVARGYAGNVYILFSFDKDKATYFPDDKRKFVERLLSNQNTKLIQADYELI